MEKKTKYMIIGGVLLALGIGAYLLIKKRGLRMSKGTEQETVTEAKVIETEKLTE